MRRKISGLIKLQPTLTHVQAVPAPHFLLANDCQNLTEASPPLCLESLRTRLCDQTAESAGLLRDVQEKLSPQEIKVLITFVHRPHIKFVASHLGSSEQTVRNQLATIRKKLGISSPIELVARVIIALFHLGGPLSPLGSDPTHLGSQP